MWPLAALAVAVVLGTMVSRAQTAALPVTEIASGIFVHNGVHEEASAANEDAIANIGFIIGDKAVAVIDPGGSFAEGSALRAAIRARTDRPTASRGWAPGTTTAGSRSTARC